MVDNPVNLQDAIHWIRMTKVFERVRKSMDDDSHDQDAIKQEIAELEEKLRSARQRLGDSNPLEAEAGGISTAKVSIELKPGGENIEVTNENKREYVE